MFTSFKELEAYVLGCGMKKRIALANAHDEPALSAVVNARRKGVVEGTLVGKKNEIIAMLHEMGESEKDYEIVDFDGEELDAAKLTVQLVREGKADIPMKGILQTSNFARAILNRETGLIPASGKRLAHSCVISADRHINVIYIVTFFKKLSFEKVGKRLCRCYNLISVGIR